MVSNLMMSFLASESPKPKLSFQKLRSFSNWRRQLPMSFCWRRKAGRTARISIMAFGELTYFLAICAASQISSPVQPSRTVTRNCNKKSRAKRESIMKWKATEKSRPKAISKGTQNPLTTAATAIMMSHAILNLLLNFRKPAFFFGFKGLIQFSWALSLLSLKSKMSGSTHRELKLQFSS